MTVKPIRLEELALEALPQPLWAYDRATLKFVWANEFAVEWLGYPREVLFSKTIVDVHPPEYRYATAEAAANSRMARRMPAPGRS